MNKGFTFIELLVALVVLMVTGAVIGVILFSTLRGANKTNILSVVRQNGNYVIEQMVKTIRNAKQFNGVSTNSTDYITDCTPAIPSPAVSPTYSSIKITDTNDNSIIFACDSNNSTILSNDISILDTSAVATSTCFFTCTQANLGDNPTIGINFSLSQKQTSTLSDNQAVVQFSTSVNTRNLAR